MIKICIGIIVIILSFQIINLTKSFFAINHVNDVLFNKHPIPSKLASSMEIELAKWSSVVLDFNWWCPHH